jgi:hypothetical protein
MNAATDSRKFTIIVTLTYVVGLTGLAHIMAGSVVVLLRRLYGCRRF